MDIGMVFLELLLDDKGINFFLFWKEMIGNNVDC